MAINMTNDHKGLTKQIKRNSEKYVRARSQAEYLQECITSKILPRSINLCKLVKSSTLWGNNSSDTFEILFSASMQLIREQYNTKVEIYEALDRKGQNLRRSLKQKIGIDQFQEEEERIKQHMLSVLRVEKANKNKKKLRDTKETEEIKQKQKALPPKKKKKRCRRFRRQNTANNENMNVGNVNVENVNSELSNHVSRIHGNVKNLSSQELTEHQFSVLELGPKFCPVEHDLNRARFQKDLNAGFRRMKLREHFYPEEDTRTEEQKRFYTKSEEWEPPNPSSSLKAHNLVIQHRFDSWKQPTRVARNLSRNQQNAIKELKENDTIDIKLDDKGGGFVIADSKDYISSALNDLENQTNISEVRAELDKKELITEIETEIEKIVDQMLLNGEILESTANYITHKVKEHKIARYYCNWKCHKYSPTQTEFSAAAVRGIVSCTGPPDEKICDFFAETEIVSERYKIFSCLGGKVKKPVS